MMYGNAERRLRQLRGLVDTMMDVRNDDEDLEHLRGEMERLLEETDHFRSWPTEWKDLGNAIVELVMDEVD